MSFFRKNPLFGIVLTICAVLVLGELALIYERFAASRAAAKRFQDRKTELEGMAQLTPPPTRETASAIEADLAKAQAALASMDNELKGRGPAAERIRNAKVPAARTDAYFDLATFVEKTRALAKKNEVDVRPEANRFGFAAFANEGPVHDHIEPVFRQRQILQYLIETLIEARPRSILSVKREPTVSKAEREARAAAIANGETPVEPEAVEGPDYFTIDPRVTARKPAFIDTMAFRFVFIGQTAALRTFLNQLASFQLPVLVREVEVDTASAEEATAQPSLEETSPIPDDASAVKPSNAASIVLSAEAPANPSEAPAPAKARPAASRGARPVTAVPIVSKPFSRFTVIVEAIELVAPAPPAEAAPAEGQSVEPTPAPSS
jgi:hypothetical protein